MLQQSEDLLMNCELDARIQTLLYYIYDRYQETMAAKDAMHPIKDGMDSLSLPLIEPAYALLEEQFGVINAKELVYNEFLLKFTDDRTSEEAFAAVWQEFKQRTWTGPINVILTHMPKLCPAWAKFNRAMHTFAATQSKVVQ
jgi:hypothetical protein